MGDAFLDGLGAEWRGGEAVDAEAVAAGFARHRRWVAWSRGLGLAGVAVAAAAGAGLARAAWTGLDPVLAVAAAPFAVAVPVMLAGLRTLGAARGFYAQTPAGMLAQSRARLQAQVRQLAGARWCAGLLAAAAVAVWPVAAASGTWRAGYLTPVAAWVVTAGLVWAWQVWRGRRLGAETSQIDGLIGELVDGPDTARSGP